MTSFSIIKTINQFQIIQNVINVNYNVFINNMVDPERDSQSVIPLSLKHPKLCQPKIPMKDRSSLLTPNLKTTDDIFHIEMAINSILSHLEKIEYTNHKLYCNWECEHFSKEIGYTHFYIIVSLIDEENMPPYYAIEIQRVIGKKKLIYYILNELMDRLNIL